ncbi:MAG TPA: LacI family DNA-binding transcriptional regulator [Bacteroidales bacterium]|nr:LacI family DNA-binding transcriptional regulator [Bacteroidales bacterium]
MKVAPASINDIARALGISASTVSRALSHHPDISADTRSKVLEYAQAIKYRPNALALGLKHQRSNTIGVVIPEIIHHFFSTIISGIEEVAYSKGLRVMICQSNEDYNREIINIMALIDHRVDGLLVSQSKATTDSSHFKEAHESGVPIVFFDRFPADMETDIVVTDDYLGGKMVTKHLIDKGCRNILHLTTSENVSVGVERHKGYADALKEAGIEYKNELVMVCDTLQKVIDSKDMLVSLAPGIDGLFAVNDFTAIALMNILQESGYDIPGRIKVAGFGDDPIASIVRPKLTTVEQKGFEMGKMAIDVLIDRIENPDSGILPRTYKFQGSVRVRESS